MNDTAKAIVLMVGGSLAWIVGAAVIEEWAKSRRPPPVHWTDANRWEKP
jgi:hypothetical protein